MKTQEIIELPIDQIREDPANPRQQFGEEELAGLAQSIRKVGQIDPILVRRQGDTFVVTDGARRLRACVSLRRSSIRAIVDDSCDDGQALATQLVTSIHNDELKPLEYAEAIQRLMELKELTASEVATYLGVSQTLVSNRLALLSLPEPVREHVATRRIPASTAAELARVADPKAQAELAEKVANGELTRDEVAKAAKRSKRKQQSSDLGRVSAQLPGSRAINLVGPGLDDVETLISWLTDLLTEAKKARGQNLELATFIRTLRDRARSVRSVPK